MRRALLLVLGGLSLLQLPRSFGHRVDELLQATLIAVAPESVVLELTVTPGVELAAAEIGGMDFNRDGTISEVEGKRYAQVMVESLELSLDDRRLKIELLGQEVASLADARAGLGLIRIKAQVKLPRVPDGEHRLVYRNRSAARDSVFLANALKPDSREIEILRQERDESQAELRITYRLKRVGEG